MVVKRKLTILQKSPCKRARNRESWWTMPCHCYSTSASAFSPISHQQSQQNKDYTSLDSATKDCAKFLNVPSASKSSHRKRHP